MEITSGQVLQPSVLHATSTVLNSQLNVSVPGQRDLGVSHAVGWGCTEGSWRTAAPTLPSIGIALRCQ